MGVNGTYESKLQESGVGAIVKKNQKYFEPDMTTCQKSVNRADMKTYLLSENVYARIAVSLDENAEGMREFMHEK